MSETYSDDEIDCGADALRRLEQGGKNLRMWEDLPATTKKKWRGKVLIVVDAIRRERARAAKEG